MEQAKELHIQAASESATLIEGIGHLGQKEVHNHKDAVTLLRLETSDKRELEEKYASQEAAFGALKAQLAAENSKSQVSHLSPLAPLYMGKVSLLHPNHCYFTRMAEQRQKYGVRATPLYYLVHPNYLIFKLFAMNFQNAI